MKILHPYNPNVRPQDQTETWEILDHIAGYCIEHVNTVEPTAYEEAIRYNWNLGKPFIIVEHDIVPTQQIIDEIASCEEEICVANYYLYECNTHIKEPISSHRIVTKGHYGKIEALKNITNEEYADLYGFGLAKITPFDRYPWMPTKSWFNVDTRLSQYTFSRAKRAHIHSTVEHNHKK